MRALRTLATVGLAVSWLAIPALVTAQTEVDTEAPVVPLARQPDGTLPLAGTPWRLRSYRHDGREAEPGPEVAAFIAFGPALYEGSGGCSKVTGRYGVSGAAIRLEPKRLKERSCPENLAVVQQAVESGLRRAAAFEVETSDGALQDELVIYSVTGDEVLRYGLDELAPLEGAEWRLESYSADGRLVPAVAGMPGLLRFLPDSDAQFKRRQSGPISGSTGCNGLVAEFYRSADVLSFSELELTDAPCGGELAAQEAAMTAILDATALRLELPADRLVLTSVDSGERLELVSKVPLEGTTWWLGSTEAGSIRGDERYTLRLDAGTASGEGPCGPYSARYVTDGAFITFSDVVGAREEACPKLRTERALISGLRRSAVVDRRSDGLVLKDATGGTTLSFGRPIAP